MTGRNVPVVKGEYGTSYSLEPSDPLKSIDYHLAMLRKNNPTAPWHPDFDLLLDARNVILMIREAYFKGACTAANPMCHYQEPHDHGGFDCDPSCPCRARPKESS